MEEKIIGGEIRTTKEGYKIIKPILDTLGIQYEMIISGSARLIQREYDLDLLQKRVMKKSNAGRKPKCNLTKIQLQREVNKIGILGVCEKYDISKKTVYRRLKQE